MDIVDLTMIAQAAGFGDYELDTPLQPRATACLTASPLFRTQLPNASLNGSALCRRSWPHPLEDLRDVDGIGEHRARTVRESLSRMAESSLEKYL